GLPTQTDATNFETDNYLRNRLRHHLLPQLATEYNPRIVQRLATLAEIMGPEDAYLDAVTARTWERYQIQMVAGAVRFPPGSLTAEPLAIARRLVRRGAASFGVDL